MRGDRQNHMHSARSPWLRAGLSITYSFMDGEILEIKKPFATNFGNQKIIREIKGRNFGNQKIIREIKRTNFGNQKIIREIKRTNFGNQKIIREIKRRNFGNQKIIREIKRRNSGNQKIIREIKRTRQESKHIIILVILLEHRKLHATSTSHWVIFKEGSELFHEIETKTRQHALPRYSRNVPFSKRISR